MNKNQSIETTFNDNAFKVAYDIYKNMDMMQIFIDSNLQLLIDNNKNGIMLFNTINNKKRLSNNMLAILKFFIMLNFMTRSRATSLTEPGELTITKNILQINIFDKSKISFYSYN